MAAEDGAGAALVAPAAASPLGESLADESLRDMETCLKDAMDEAARETQQPRGSRGICGA